MSFQIIESNRSLPSQGPNAQFSGSTDTGAGMTARAMGGLGSSIANLGMDLFVAQGQAELTEKMAGAKEQISRMHLDLEKETDPERYQQIFQETWADIEATEVKNGWASREWKLQMPDLKARQQQVVGLAQRQRVRENHTIALANAEADATRTGNMKAYENLLTTQIQEGWLSQEAAELKRNEVRHKATQQAMSAAAYQNPETILSWKSAEEMQKVYPYALPTDLTWIQGVANNRLQMAGAAQKQKSEEIETQITAAIARFDTSDPKLVENLSTEIDKAAQAGILDGTQIRQLTHFLDSRIAHAGKDVTQLEMLDATDAIETAIEARKKEEAKRLLRENSWMFTAPKNDELLKDIREMGTKTTDTILTDALSAEEAVADAEQQASTKTPEEVAQIRLKSMNRKELIRQQWKKNLDMTNQQKTSFLQELLQPAKDEAAKTGIRNWMKKNWEWYRYGTKENLTLQGRLRKQREEANLPMVFNDADFEALPSGKEFIDPDGNRRKKVEAREKGLGYFGELKRPDGRVSTELSISVNINGKETEIPSLVPTLTKAEIDYLLAGNRPTKEIVQKAVDHAKQRMAEGKDVFAQLGEATGK